MSDLFTIQNLITLFLLVLLQAVLGFDNLLYISLESKKAPKEKQPFIRTMGIGLAIFLRIGLLFILHSLIASFQDPVLHLDFKDVFYANFNIHSFIVLGGGVFIIYTATKEIWHMISFHENESDTPGSQKSAASIITWIVIMNLVFSFDSILSAMALSDSLSVMAVAIVISGVLMIWLSGTVSTFLQKNRMYEVLGLFVLLIVGVMLITEGGHLAHIKAFGNEIVPMSKTTFYFVLVVLVLVDVVQGKYQKNIIAKK